MKPQTFKHISRCIDKHGVHHLDALDEWTALVCYDATERRTLAHICSKMGIEDTLK
jgi:hypothetical protein